MNTPPITQPEALQESPSTSKSPYVSRDLSWLYFNHRVLQEAADPRVPLYERIKFLAIYSSNLDEYFRVRVSSLRQFRELKKKDRKELTVKPKKALKEIKIIVKDQQEQFGQIFREEILPALKSHQIHLVRQVDFDETQQAFGRMYFEEKLKPLLKQQYIDRVGIPPFLEDRKLYLVVQFEDEQNSLALTKIPTDELPRFIQLPSPEGEYHITFLDELIRFNLNRLYAGEVIKDSFAIKVSRDAELYIDDEYSGNLIEKIKANLSNREDGLPTRFLYDAEMPKPVLKTLRKKYNLSKYDLIPGARYHNFNDFFGFPNPLKNADFHDMPLPPLPHPVLSDAPAIIPELYKQDHILHFPYQDYGVVTRLIEEASEDSATTSIKISLYRVAKDSAISQALIKAVQNGKSVVVFVEAKARFDEQSNLFWGDQLKRAGAKVLYSYPGIKVHSKILLIEREQEGRLSRVAYIGTGNFNEKTAKLYADHALLTTHSEIGADLSQVFQVLEGTQTEPEIKHLLVSPFTLRSRFIELIDREIASAQKGEEAYMILKMNSLQDRIMVEKLYEASQAGVNIQLIIRGICSLVPGIPGISDRIEVKSIVDRFLEHARIYIFGNSGEEQMFIASADWMTRNLDRRIEVATPILQSDVYHELRTLVNTQLADNQKARWITENQSNVYVEQKEGEAPIRSQEVFYKWLAEQ